MARSRHLQAKYAANHRKRKNAAQQQQQSIEGERSDDGEPSRRRQRLDSDASAFADAGGGAEGGVSGQVVGGNAADSGQVDGLATAQRTIQDGPLVGCDVGMFSYCVFVNNL